MIKQTYLIISILLGVWLTACQDFEDPVGNSSVVDGDRVEVSIRTNLPSITVQTKANTEATQAEKQLIHVDVLVFEVDEENNETFAYRTTHTNDLSTLDYNNIEIKAKLKISKNSEKYRIVFITNLEQEINTFFGANDEQYVGTPKESLLKELTFIQEEIWAATDADPRPLPMWGETSTAAVIIKDMSSSAFGSLNLLRSVARIGLSVSIGDDQVGGSDIFEIKSVKVYNARVKGRVTPDADNIEDGEAILPSLVDGSETIATDTDRPKYLVPSTGENQNKVTGIYINEASNQVEGEEVFLIIEAIYKKEDSSNTTPSFYRVGFYDIDDDPVDILRNFTYNMIITGVNGNGEEEEEDAVNSTTSNLTVSMTNWSGGEMKYVVFNGKYYLAVSDSEQTIPKSAGEHSFLVKTNYPDGWQAKVSEGKSWLTGLTPVSGPKDESRTITFYVTENDEGENRNGEISISCGNDHLSLEVNIIQTIKKEYTLIIEIDDQANLGSYVDFNKTITFTSGYHDFYEGKEIPSRTLRVTWTPADEDLIVDYNRYFEWGNDTDIETSYSAQPGAQHGFAEIHVVPSRLDQRDDWFPETVGDIQFQVGDEGNTRQNVLIRRKHHEVYIEKADRYVVEAGKKYSFNLFANTNWVIKNPFNDDQAWLGDMVEINENDIRGGSTLQNTIENSAREISFTFKDEVTGENISTDVSVLIEFEDLGEWISKEYTFHIYGEENPGVGTRFAEEANCYVLQTGGDAVSIPVSQANRFTKANPNSPYKTYPIPDNGTLKVKFIWTDHANGFNNDMSGNAPVVSAEMETGKDKGPDARLIITSGNSAGNAVIAVTDENDKIHWSWHIWVVDEIEKFNPYDETAKWPGFRYYEFLDRNLGALTAQQAGQSPDPKSMGLYYQWGRKDPFPTADDIGSSTLSRRYQADGTILSWDTSGNGSSTENDNLLYSIQNPAKFIGTSAGDHWFSTHWTIQAPATEDFWNVIEKGSLSTSVKGIFDPCPEGWKTVPAGDQLAEEWNNLLHIVDRSNPNYSIVQAGDIDLGVWPHTGIINKSEKKITNINEGQYWTATANGYTYSFRTHFTQTTSEPSTSQAKAAGLPIRCIRRVSN